MYKEVNTEINKSSQTKNILIWSLVVIVCIGIFFLGRNSNKPIVETKLPDTTQFQKSIDSIAILYNMRGDSIKTLKINLSALKAEKVINNKKVNNDIKKANNFTPTQLHRANDSVLTAEGLK